MCYITLHSMSRRGLAFFTFTLISSGQGIITTIAGTDFVFRGDGKPALQAELGGAFDVAAGADGSVYAADYLNHQVVRVSTGGTLTVVAGNGISGYSGDGGPARNASFSSPRYIALDGRGNLFIADTGLRVVRRVGPDGIVTTVAGTGAPGDSGDGGPALLATFGTLSGIAVDANGFIYVSDSSNHRVRRIAPDSTIEGFAGNGRPGFGGDDGPAPAASLFFPNGLAVDASGNLYIADQNNARVRRVSPDRTIATVAGGGNGRRDGVPATQTSLTTPTDVDVDAAGNLYITETALGIVRRVGPDQVVHTFAGRGDNAFEGDGGPASQAALSNPFGVASDPLGAVYIADTNNLRVRRVGPDGIITTIAGIGQTQSSGDNGPAVSASFGFPTGLVIDPFGNIFVSDESNHRVRKISPDGTIRTAAGTGDSGDSGDGGPATQARLFLPIALASDFAGNVYISEPTIGPQRIRKLSPDGTISAAAGKPPGANPSFPYVTIPATSATFSFPSSIAAGPDGSLFVLDTFFCSLFRVGRDGLMSHVAGLNVQPCNTDLFSDPAPALLSRLPASNAILNGSQIQVSNTGTVYLTNPTLRKIFRIAGGSISRVAGNGETGSPANGASALGSPLLRPMAIAADAAGNLVFSDSTFIRRIERNNTLTTIAGSSDATALGDGGPATAARLFPGAMRYDARGNLIFTDLLSGRVRAILASPPALAAAPDSLEFNGQSGSAAPLPQTFRVSAAVPGVAFQTSVTTADSGNWLKVSPDSGAAPRVVEITADPSNLTAGDHTGKITILSPTAAPLTRDISVTIHVAPAAPAKAAVDKQNFSFAFPRAAERRSETLTVSNAGGGSLDFAVTAETSSGGSWLSAQASTRRVTGSGALVTVTADPGSLPPGTYRGRVHVDSLNGSTIDIPATMTISSIDQAILLSQTGLSFTAVSGGGVIPPGRFDVLNIGRGAVAWSVSASTLSGGPAWLSVEQTRGSSVAGATPPSVTLRVDGASLAPGTYYGLVRVDAPGAANSPQVLTVFLNVLPEGTNPGAMVDPPELVFTAAAGGPSPGSRDFFVYNVTASPKTYRATTSSEAGPASLPLAILPGDATLDPALPNRVVVQPFTTGLAPGVYTTTVNLQFDDGLVRSVPVRVIVAPGPTAAAAAKSAGRRADTCAANALLLSFTSFASSSLVTTGWPVPIILDVRDDCGEAFTAGSVTVSFSNGDPPIALRSLLDGRWAETWPSAKGTRAQVTVKAEASAADGRVKGQNTVSLGVNQPQDQPVFSASAVVSLAGSPAFTPLAPGSLITISGERLAEVAQTAGSPPLPFTLGHAEVIMAGRSLPLVSVSPARIEAVVPFGLPVNTTHQLLILRGNTYSRTVPVDVAPAQPAIFPAAEDSAQGQIYFLRGADRTPQLATPANPARSGDTLLILCAGLGEVTPAVPDGEAAPSAPRDTAASVSVNIGGANAAVASAGLVAGSVGRYQIMTRVPDGAGAGSQVPVTISVAGQTSPAVMMAVQ